MRTAQLLTRAGLALCLFGALLTGSAAPEAHAPGWVIAVVGFWIFIAGRVIAACAPRA